MEKISKLIYKTLLTTGMMIPIDISYYDGYYNITQALGNNLATYFDGVITNVMLFPDGLYAM